MFSANASQVSDESLAVESVFSAYTYTGNGSTQTINNGIDLAGKGGLVWSKRRSGTASNHILQDTSTGIDKRISPSTGAAVSDTTCVTSVSSTGYSIGTSDGVNTASETYISWTFRKAPKFFDVVTWTGDGVSARTVAHALGQMPGMIFAKRTDSTGAWAVWHNALGNANLVLNSVAAATTPDNGNYWGSDAGYVAPTATAFTPGKGSLNVAGATYVAYLFAHDTAADGIVQCGSFTTDGSGAGSVDHGVTAGIQFAMLKCASTTGDWEMYDTARTSGFTGNDARLHANLASAEDSVARISSSGTTLSFAGLSASQTYVYMFIVAPTP